jgi:D-glycero-D-manno-heptose 1,7-bisphosphate phosphatase
MARALARLRQAGARLAVVTNQPDVSRGLVSRTTLTALHRSLDHLDAVYLCPHTAQDQCQCRKPSSHWLRVAARHLAISLPHSYFVGDRPTDAQTGLNAGLIAVLVVPRPRPSAIASVLYKPDLDSAATAILAHRADTSRTQEERTSWNSATFSTRPAGSAT